MNKWRWKTEEIYHSKSVVVFPYNSKIIKIVHVVIDHIDSSMSLMMCLWMTLLQCSISRWNRQLLTQIEMLLRHRLLGDSSGDQIDHMRRWLKSHLVQYFILLWGGNHVFLFNCYKFLFDDLIRPFLYKGLVWSHVWNWWTNLIVSK